MKKSSIDKIKSKIQKIIDLDKNVIFVNCYIIDVYYRADNVLVISYCKDDKHINDGPEHIEVPANELSNIYYTIDNSAKYVQFKLPTSNDLVKKYFRLILRETPQEDMHQLADTWQILGIKNIIFNKTWIDTNCPV